MSWLAPIWLAGAAVAAGAVVLLHFLARRRPVEQFFPTTRFVPVAPARATTRAVRPTDLLLLLMRVTLIMLIGAAFARPVLMPERRPRATVILADRSRAVADMAEVVRAIAAARMEDDLVIAFDSAVRRLAADTIIGVSPARSTARGSVSAALIAGFRAADSLRAHADAVEIVLISPLAREELDAATDRIRSLWRGPIRLVSIRAAESRAATGIEMSASEYDPVRAGVALAGLLRTTGSARVVRQVPTDADLSWAREGHVLVFWPRAFAAADTEPALLAGEGGGLIAPGPFLRQVIADDGTAIAWWIDGGVAVRERPLGAGCVRDVAADPGIAGDVALRPSFARLVAWLGAPCGHPDFSPVADSVRIAMSEAPPRPPVRADAPNTRDSPLSRWLFLGAAVMAALEPLARRRRPHAAD